MLAADDRGDKEEHPPPYNLAPQLPRTHTSSSTASRTSAPRLSPSVRHAGSSHATQGLPNIPVTNFLTIRRADSWIKGTYVIDPGLQVPDESLLGGDSSSTASSRQSKSAPGSSERDSEHGARKNLCFECSNKSISVDVWLVGDDSAYGRQVGVDERRALLDLKTDNGFISLRLNSTKTRPFTLTAFSQNGSVTVALPPDFVGPVTMSTFNGEVELSDTMQTRLVTFSEVDGKRTGFVGDFRRNNYTGRQDWNGSTVDIGGRNGRVRLSFVDEEETKISGNTKSINNSGFMRRIFRG